VGKFPNKIAIILFYAVICSCAFASWNQGQKITASDGATGDNFGMAVSLSGDYLMIGTPYDVNSGKTCGTVYVYKYNAGTWAKHSILVSSDSANNDRFGSAVCVKGNQAIVGSYYKGSQKGQAYIFTFSSTTSKWLQTAILSAPSPTNYDQFGFSVAIDGDYAMAGTPQDDENASNSGSVFVYKKNLSGVWSYSAICTASDYELSAYFGCAIAMADPYAVIGARNADYSGIAAGGGAYVFKRSGSSWSQLARLSVSGIAMNDHFGKSAAISSNGQYIVVGSPDDSNGSGLVRDGSAYVYKLVGSTWVQVQKLRAKDAASYDHFGSAVAIDGNTIAISAPRDSDTDGGTRAVYIFTLSGSTWVQTQKIIVLIGTLGSGVSIDDDLIAIGAYLDDTKGSDAGAAYIYNDCPADITGDCMVNMLDLKVLAEQWLSAPSIPSADIYPIGGDNWVGFKDFAELAGYWGQY
jgi:hypothetical protein